MVGVVILLKCGALSTWQDSSSAVDFGALFAKPLVPFCAVDTGSFGFGATLFYYAQSTLQ